MENPFCPNYNLCKLVTVEGFIRDEIQLKKYLTDYCKAGDEKWSNCKRLIVKNILHFCPDFVLPDSDLTPDQIIDKFDNENIN